MLRTIKRLVKSSPLVKPAIFAKGLVTRPVSQNEEATIIRRLLSRYEVPKLFVEFGFSGWEFNCASLIETWEGLLLDGLGYNITIGNIIYPKNINVLEQWLTLETLGTIRDFVADRPLGILSIDVDGNDYWFLEDLISLRPSIVSVEYNASLGHHAVTVPYDPAFDRRTKHESRTYFGASLIALTRLASQHGYSLIDVTQSGINAFFVRNDHLTDDDIVLDPHQAYREKLFPDHSRPSQQWDRIKHLPFVEVH